MPQEWFVYGLDENDEEHLVGIFARWSSIIHWMENDWSMTSFYGMKVVASEELKARIKENFSSYGL
jgi:hypothetical protein